MKPIGFRRKVPKGSVLTNFLLVVEPVMLKRVKEAAKAQGINTSWWICRAIAKVLGK